MILLLNIGIGIGDATAQSPQTTATATATNDKNSVNLSNKACLSICIFFWTRRGAGGGGL